MKYSRNKNLKPLGFILKYNLFVLLFLSLSSSSHYLNYEYIMTVNGSIEAKKMGTTLIHEHVMVDWIGADSTGYHRWNRNEVVLRVLPFLEEIKQYGVNTFLDCTPAYLGRDPYILKELSDKTGLNILTNTGYYGAKNNKFVPKIVFEASPEEIAKKWIDEFNNGIDSSGIRPGFIKISVDQDNKLSNLHEKLIRAAALTHLNTGLTIVSHTGPQGPALAQITILKQMGVSSEAFVWTHAQSGTMEGYVKAAEQGAWISLDNVSAEPERIKWYIKTLCELKEKKLLSHVLISHDAGWYDVGEEIGGDFRGYTAVFTKLVPELKKNNFSKKDIDLLLRDNPKRAYTIKIRKL